MRKKLMAVAVAGALAAPMIAVAQSTVTISGRLTYEYGQGDQGANRKDVDYADSPGGSNINFRGTENLGGGLSAWFQCETSADTRGFDTVGLCSRNTAVGLRGGFGNVYFGRWDTPMKKALNMGSVGAEETGLLGMSFIGFGGSGGASSALGFTVDPSGLIPSASANAGPFGDTAQRQRWKRRETCLSTYDSPNFGGFTVMAAFSCGNAPADNAYTDANTNQKPRVQSVAATYVNGPLQAGFGYEKHIEMGSPLALTDLDDKGWGGGVSYGFAGGNILVGFTWLRREWETGAGLETKKDTWSLGLDWRLAGPHQVQFQYAKALDSKGNGGAIGGNGGAAAAGPDTGADAISIAYQYHLSKRTSFKVGYVKVDNDANSNSVRIGNTAALLATAAGGTLGQNVDSWAFLVKHNF